MTNESSGEIRKGQFWTNLAHANRGHTSLMLGSRSRIMIGLLLFLPAQEVPDSALTSAKP